MLALKVYYHLSTKLGADSVQDTLFFLLLDIIFLCQHIVKQLSFRNRKDIHGVEGGQRSGIVQTSLNEFIFLNQILLQLYIKSLILLLDVNHIIL